VWNTASDTLSLAQKFSPFTSPWPQNVKYCSSPSEYLIHWVLLPQLRSVLSYCCNNYGRRTYRGMFHSHQSTNNNGRVSFLIFKIYIPIQCLGTMDWVQMIQLSFTYFVILVWKLMAQCYTSVRGTQQPLWLPEQSSSTETANSTQTRVDGCDHCITDVYNDQLLQINSTHMCCDSQIVLHWLNSDKKLKQISNRVIHAAGFWSDCFQHVFFDAYVRGYAVACATVNANKTWHHNGEQMYA